MKQMINKTQSGFTLIELLVVVATIGLVSSIILANIVEARKKAEGAYVVSTLRQIGNAISLYDLQNSSFPDAAYGDINPNNVVSAVTMMNGFGTCIGEGPCELNNAVSQNNTILNQLTPYFSAARTLKAHSVTYIQFSNYITARGYWYGCSLKDDIGKCTQGILMTYIAGKVSCPTLQATLNSSSRYIPSYAATYCSYTFGQ